MTSVAKAFQENVNPFRWNSFSRKWLKSSTLWKAWCFFSQSALNSLKRALTDYFSLLELVYLQKGTIPGNTQGASGIEEVEKSSVTIRQTFPLPTSGPHQLGDIDIVTKRSQLAHIHVSRSIIYLYSSMIIVCVHDLCVSCAFFFT